MCAVLIIEDELILAANIKAYLERYDYAPTIAASGEEGLVRIDGLRPEIVLLDSRLSGMGGLRMLEALRERGPYAKFIVMTRSGDAEAMAQARRAGAYDCLSKPVMLRELKLMLDKATGKEQTIQTKQTTQALDALCRGESRADGLNSLIGDSPPMAQLKDMIRRLVEAEYALADGDPPAVLITGETGTGKELVARALHVDGPRKAQPFIEINCASIPTHLLEAELFGYERGAFTDARERKQGLIEAADGGTLFLDEIGEIDFPVQVKLLKVLEEKKVRRLGGLREARVNFRIIAATNQDLEQRVQEGKFRADLYFRLRMMHMALPPLRDRRDDILLLARTFLAMHGARYRKPDLFFTPEAEQVLMQYSWPGNVREMRNLLEQIVLMAQGPAIGPDQMPNLRQLAPASAGMQAAPSSMLPLPEPDLNLEQMERSYLVQALEKTRWNVTQAAKLLGLSRDTLRYRMEKYDLRNAGCQ